MNKVSWFFSGTFKVVGGGGGEVVKGIEFNTKNTGFHSTHKKCKFYPWSKFFGVVIPFKPSKNKFPATEIKSFKVTRNVFIENYNISLQVLSFIHKLFYLPFYFQTKKMFQG